MRKQLLKGSLSLLTCACLLTPTSNVFAGTANNSSVSPAVYSQIIESTVVKSVDDPLRGTSIPNEKTAVDLSTGSILAFDVKSLRYGNLFMNNRFTGVNSIKVNISNITVEKNGSALPVDKLIVTVYKGALFQDKVAEKKISTAGGSLTFTGLSKNTKYYIEFSKTNDGQYFSFDGTVSSND